MHTGYSILLSEYIDAQKISYTDCESFQIVCPACKEPVFKVARSSEEKEIEYLSHYQKGGYESECELRVSSIHSDELKEHNSKSREQKLSYFLSVFLSALEKDPYQSYNKGLKHSHKQINRSKAFRAFREQHFNSGRKGGMADKELFKESAEFYLKEGEDIGGLPKTGFSTETQIRIASDMMELLVTNHGRSNYYALFNHSASYLIHRCYNLDGSATAKDNEVMQTVAQYISGLIRSGKNSGMKLLSQMSAQPIYPPHVEAPATYILKVASEIAHEMIGTLIRLPYFELLKENQNHNKT